MHPCIILAGGFGTRLKSITGDIPKPMINVGHEPFLYKLMRNLEEQGCNLIILSLHYQSDYIIRRIEKDCPVKCRVEFSIENKPLGTGGALKEAAKFVDSDYFLAVNGDSFSDIEYKKITIEGDDCDLLMVASTVPNVERFGSLLVDENAHLLEMSEKGAVGDGLINIGVYCLNKTKILSYSKSMFSIEKDFIPSLSFGRVKVKFHNGIFIDIGIPSDFKKACELLA